MPAEIPMKTSDKLHLGFYMESVRNAVLVICREDLNQKLVVINLLTGPTAYNTYKLLTKSPTSIEDISQMAVFQEMLNKP